MRHILAIVGGFLIFALLAIGLGVVRYQLSNQGSLNADFMQNLAGVLHIVLPALVSGLFIGLVIKNKPWLWSQSIFVLSLALWFYVWSATIVVGSWWPLIVLMPLALAGGAVLGNWLVRRRGT